MVVIEVHPHKGDINTFDVTCFLNNKKIRKEVGISADRVKIIKGFYTKFLNHKY